HERENFPDCGQKPGSISSLHCAFNVIQPLVHVAHQPVKALRPVMARLGSVLPRSKIRMRPCHAPCWRAEQDPAFIGVFDHRASVYCVASQVDSGSRTTARRYAAGDWWLVPPVALALEPPPDSM